MVTKRFLFPALVLAGCANIWGFEELNEAPPPPPPVVCLGSIAPCPTGCSLCTSRCVDLETDEANCGSCGTQCTGGRSCEEGVCTCAEDTTPCGGLCVDTSSDPMNCGDCGTACDPGGACNAGACTFPVVLSMGQGTPGPIVVDADRVYFGGGDAIYSIAKDGSDLLTLGSGSVRAMALQSDTLFYVSGLSIFSMPVSGATPTLLATTTTAAGAVAADATHVYWVESGSVHSVEIESLAASVLTTGSVGGTTIALDARGVYFGYSSGVYRTPLTGGSMTLMGNAASTVVALALDETNIYAAGGGIAALSIEGGTIRTLSDLVSPNGLAVDESSVYFFNATSLGRVPKSGGDDVTVLAIDSYPAGELATDETNVYWTSGGEDGFSGAVMMVAK